MPGTTFREVIAWPLIASLLPWRFGFRLLDAVARRVHLHPEATATALAGAASIAGVGNREEWERRYRLTRLVDHCDLFLMRTRGRRWFARHVRVDGDWPRTGPFIAMTFHWGAGLWALDDIRATRLPVHFVSARLSEADFHGDVVALRYARLRNRTVEQAGGAPIIYTGGAREAIRAALSAGRAVAALYDVPPTLTGRTLSSSVCGRKIVLPAGFAALAAETRVPIVPFAMRIDYATGERSLSIEASFVAETAQAFADRLAQSLTRLLTEDTAAWHFSGLAQHFFAPAHTEATEAVQAR
jgi:hypothetical protein